MTRRRARFGRPRRLLTALGLGCLLIQTVGAQGRPGEDGSRANIVEYSTAHLARVVDAIRIDGPIRIDGVLDESEWSRALPATDFVQWEPDPGQPATYRTEVRFLYDGDNLYVGAWCFDPDPDGLVVNDLKRDFRGTAQDGFTVFIDSMNDRRSGFLFATNPAGAKRDSEVANDGEQNNADWDAVWDLKVQILPDRWTVEMVIPFKTLRFKDPPSREWSINMTRHIQRLNEDSHWAPLPRRYRVFRASLAGTLRGFDQLSQSRNLKFKPYLNGRPHEAPRAGERRFTDAVDGGVDLKYGLTQALTLDLTYRTDFAQVEADQQQVNLTRFNVFFPEKREFFLENRDLFNFGVRGGGTGGAGNNLLPFFSRRIGLSPAGTPVPIVGGGRISGRAKTYDIGMLMMRTEASPGMPANTFTVGRIRRSLSGNSWIGGILTNRQSSLAGDHNRVIGIDANFQAFQKLDLTSYWLRSQTPGRQGDDQAKSVEATWRDDDVSVRGLYEQVQANFNPELGFIRRRDTEHLAGSVSVLPRVRHRYVRNFNLSAGMDYYARWRGGVETRQRELEAGAMLHSSSSITARVTHLWDRLLEPFTIRPGVTIPIGDYDYIRQEIVLNLDRSRRVSGGANVSWGSFWDGSQTTLGGTLELKPHYRFTAELNYMRSSIDLPHGSFSTHLAGTRLLYSFSTRMFLHAFLQYNADTMEFSSNVRFNVTYRPLSDIYVVFNDRRDPASGDLFERAVTVKLAHLFSF